MRTILFFCLFFTLQATAQDIQYLDKEKKPCTKANATSFRLITAEQQGFLFEEYTIGKKTPIFIGRYKDKEGKIKNGDFKYYHNGYLSSEGAFVNNYPEGAWKTYYTDTAGIISEEEFFKNGSRHGKNIKYYLNGKIKRDETFHNGLLTMCSCYGVNGQDTLCFPFEEWPCFPGGESKLYEYLQRSIKYPADEKNRHITGTVYIHFFIDKQGKVTEASVEKGVQGGPGLDAEALRVVSEMPAWEPGKLEGKLVKVQFILPIKFSL